MFIEKRNEYSRGGQLRRFVSSMREVTGVDGRVLSSEVFRPARTAGRAARAAVLPGRPGHARLRPIEGDMVTSLFSAGPVLAVIAGGAAGGGLFLLVAALRGLPGRPGRQARFTPPGPAARRAARCRRPGCRGSDADPDPVDTGAIGVALLILTWRTLSGAAAERRTLARLEALATWTESLRDTIAGAVGLEQAIPASLRAAAPSLHDPLAWLVNRLHTRMPMAEALRIFADDLDDPGAT